MERNEGLDERDKKGGQDEELDKESGRLKSSWVEWDGIARKRNMLPF